MVIGAALIPGMHQLLETDFLRFVRRRAGRRGQRLMSYWDNSVQKFVVGLWTNRLAGMCITLLTYEADEQLELEHVDQVLFNVNNDLRVRAIKNWTNKQATDNRASFNQQLDTERRRADFRNYLRKKLPPRLQDDPRLLACF